MILLVLRSRESLQHAPLGNLNICSSQNSLKFCYFSLLVSKFEQECFRNQQIIGRPWMPFIDHFNNRSKPISHHLNFFPWEQSISSHVCYPTISAPSLESSGNVWVLNKWCSDFCYLFHFKCDVISQVEDTVKKKMGGCTELEITSLSVSDIAANQSRCCSIAAMLDPRTTAPYSFAPVIACQLWMTEESSSRSVRLRNCQDTYSKLTFYIPWAVKDVKRLWIFFRTLLGMVSSELAVPALITTYT